MKATKSADDKQAQKNDYNNLDAHYGEVGISAVAAAMRYQGEQRRSVSTRYSPPDCD